MPSRRGILIPAILASIFLASSVVAQYATNQFQNRRIRDAYRAERDQDYNQAITLYTEIIDSSPNNPDLYRRRGEDYRRLNK
jgi:tetratricopeptide (TPR) repeat protein